MAAKDTKATAPQAQEATSRSLLARIGNYLRHVLYGDQISSTFFSRNKFTIFIIVGLIMTYITFKYECQTSMEQIDILEKELAIVKSESIRERSTYRSNTRESMMQHRIDSLNLALKVQQQPPFLLTYDK